MAYSSIGNMTNTLIESGSRHMQQCRTNYDVLLAMAGTEDDLLNNDDKWCMGKDELVVVCNKHIDDTTAKTATKYAYPSVVTTLGDMTEYEKLYLASYYHFMGEHDSKSMKVKCMEALDGHNPTLVAAAEKSTKTSQYREFLPVGYSVGRACAHGFKGDTVASVQIGGLRTVLNGAFDIQTGDLIQMYIPDAEGALFEKNGGRMYKPQHSDVLTELTKKVGDSNVQEKRRKNFYNRGQGMGSKGGSDRIKSGMFSIKPYLESLNEDQLQYYGDKIRVFARAVSSARPFEPVDIMIARQAL